MPTQHDIHFTANDIQLTGTLHLPHAPHPPFVIGCHGLLANRNSPKQIALAEALNRLGIAYFRFDHRGCGDSQGHFDTENVLETRCSDLYHAIDTMQRHPQTGQLAGLFGSSFGGTVILATAAENSVPYIATYAAPITSNSIKRPSINEIQTNNPFLPQQTASYQFDITDRLSSVSRILIMHGDQDEIVPVSHARTIHDRTIEPKQLIIHEAGDHRMTNPKHQKHFIENCPPWFAQFIA